MKTKRGLKVLEILNSKPVIGALIFIILGLSMVLAGNVIVKEGNLDVEENLNVTGNITASEGRVYDKTGYAGIPGEMRMYGGATAPSGWLLCNGANVSRTTYADLFTAIGTTFGAGDGSTTFTLPDLRGIFPRGAGTSGKLNRADGNAFAATLGTYSNDEFQKHKHSGTTRVWANTAEFLGGNNGNFASSNVFIENIFDGYAADGAYGTPRADDETAPANLGVTYIIKY